MAGYDKNMDRPRGDRNFSGDKPRMGDRPYGDRPRGDRPYGDRPRGDRPYGDRPRGDRPYGDRPQGDRPYGDRPRMGRKPRMEKPLADARRAALSALFDVFYKDAFAQIALNREIESVSLSDEDRRLATSLFYATVENRMQLEFYLKQFVAVQPDKVVMTILLMSVAQLLYMDKIPDFAVVNEATNLTRSYGFDAQAGFVNGVLRAFARARDAGELKLPDAEAEPVRHLSIAHSVPETLVERLIAAYGFDFAREMLAWKPDEHRETIRFNAQRHDAESFEKFMTARGWAFEKAPVPGAYFVSGQGNLANEKGFLSGEYSVQSAPSLLSALAVKAKPGMNIIDACAAPGGKAAAMAEAMHETGRVHAWDVYEHRVRILTAVAKRLGLDNMRPAVRDASKLKESSVNEMDAVLLDAPCSGIGVLGNKPDAKYKYTNSKVDELVELQKNLLDTVCQYVRPGGALVYSTCTVLPEENEEQVRAFLERHPDFHLAEFDVPEEYKSGLKDGMLTLHSHIHHCEGFFIARMERDE
ncbi:MAG: 16S rRNA (cytosine(967)-C(5))-methyltransferase RsmB [Clostridiales bacterium]|nr:16S rRNA (cytosine(967)-C(5))-methyltransferase RsmB [Clostridiales bacterium]